MTPGQHVGHGSTGGGVGNKLKVGCSIRKGVRRRSGSARIEENMTARRFGTKARGAGRYLLSLVILIKMDLEEANTIGALSVGR